MALRGSLLAPRPPGRWALDDINGRTELVLALITNVLANGLTSRENG